MDCLTWRIISLRKWLITIGVFSPFIDGITQESGTKSKWNDPKSDPSSAHQKLVTVPNICFKTYILGEGLADYLTNYHIVSYC